MNNKNFQTNLTVGTEGYHAFLLLLAHSVHGRLQFVKLLTDNITLSCDNGTSSKADSDKATWQFNSRDLLVDSTRLQQRSNSQLEIIDLKYSDSGIYSCFIDSKFFHSILLTVEGMI